MTVRGCWTHLRARVSAKWARRCPGVEMGRALPRGRSRARIGAGPRCQLRPEGPVSLPAAHGVACCFRTPCVPIARREDEGEGRGGPAQEREARRDCTLPARQSLRRPGRPWCVSSALLVACTVGTGNFSRLGRASREDPAPDRPRGAAAVRPRVEPAEAGHGQECRDHRAHRGRWPWGAGA